MKYSFGIWFQFRKTQHSETLSLGKEMEGPFSLFGGGLLSYSNSPLVSINYSSSWTIYVLIVAQHQALMNTCLMYGKQVHSMNLWMSKWAWMNEWMSEWSNSPSEWLTRHMHCSFQFLFPIAAYCSFQFPCWRTNHFRSRGCFLDYTGQDYQTSND